MHFPEIVAMGIYDSDIAAKGKAISTNRTTTMFELELSLEKGGISYIGSAHQDITQNLFVCAKPGQVRHTRFPFRCYYVHVIVAPGKLHDLLSSLPNFMTVDDPAQYRLLFEQMSRFYDTGLETDRVMTYSLLLKLIYRLYQASASSSAEGENKTANAVITQVVTYINDNLASDLSLNALAKRYSFSPTHFHKYFKSATGKTLREYVEHQRITKAINQLVTTNMTLTQIAYECGFSSQAYFSFAFKRSTGKTPREYAKEIFDRFGSVQP